MAPLIRYLEREMLGLCTIKSQIRSLTSDFELLLHIQDEVAQKWNKVTSLVTDGNLKSLLLWDSDFEKYEKQFNSLKYMSDLSEDTLWILYEQALD